MTKKISKLDGGLD